MTQPKTIHRRALLGAGIAAAPLLAAGRASSDTRPARPATTFNAGADAVVSATSYGISPSRERDQTLALQAAIDDSTANGSGLVLSPGEYVVGGLRLRPGTRIVGAPGRTTLRYNASGVGLFAERADGFRLEHLRIDGGDLPLDANRIKALLHITDSTGIVLDGVQVVNSRSNGVYLERSSGRITASTIASARDAAIWSLDADVLSGSLSISHTTVNDCRNNGILIWRSEKGHDGSRLSDLTISRIGNSAGGTGQYGNGVNVFRAADVAVTNSRIADCAYSAVRGNASGNIQMLGNHVARIGEVALYAEFGFEGAMIANNVIDGAAAGISITNFNVGGRLAVVQGNLIRRLVRREHEPVDKRGEGIAVEADAVVTGNVIEGAPTAGIMIGWGEHLRDVVATGNLIRASTIGIAVSGDVRGGQCLLANNMISGASNGAIRAMRNAEPIGTPLPSADAPKHITLSGNVVA